jgi:hypothetical protein
MFGKKKNNERPELRAGDVVCTEDTPWTMVVNHDEDGFWGYAVEGRTLTSVAVRSPLELIVEIYRAPDGSGIFGDGELAKLVNSRPEKWRVWKRENSVKEMTVDEISKALGYEVKVVGNDRR